MSESSSGSEFLLGIEEYLRYLNKESQANSVHTVARTLATENAKTTSVCAFMQDLGSQIRDTNRELADLLHRVVSSSDIASIGRALLHYIGKTSIDDRFLKDLIFGIIKADDTVSSYKPLLQYIGKTLIDDKVLSDLIHGVKKSKTLIESYVSILQFIGNTLVENQTMASLAFAIQRAVNSDNFEDNFTKAYLAMLDRQFLNDKIFRGINNCLKTNIDRSIVNDAFSRSQVKSKIWLIEQLTVIQPYYKNVAVMAGWFGQLKSIYEKKLTYDKMRIIEIDKNACEASDYIFNLSNLENYKVKSVLANITQLILHRNGYEWEVENFKDGTKYNEKFLPDLIINTSAEHMTDEWFHQIRFKDLDITPIVAIQSNNLFDIPEHVNCVYSIDHMKKKFPMKEILFEGELQLKGYKRVMLIGRP